MFNKNYLQDNAEKLTYFKYFPWPSLEAGLLISMF